MNLIDADKLGYADVECVDGNTYMVVHEPEIRLAPSAFEGMTNGEVMKAVFESDNVQFNETGSWIHIVINGMDYSFCPVEFWNSPYQKGGE